jgi:hypothetical protein
VYGVNLVSNVLKAPHLGQPEWHVDAKPLKYTVPRPDVIDRQVEVLKEAVGNQQLDTRQIPSPDSKKEGGLIDWRAVLECEGEAVGVTYISNVLGQTLALQSSYRQKPLTSVGYKVSTASDGMLDITTSEMIVMTCC